MLDDREHAFEQAFVHDEEARFLMLSHRNKLFGRWAADLLGYSGAVADRYVEWIVETVGTPALGAQTPDDRIVSRVEVDFKNAGVTVKPDAVRDALQRFEAASTAQLRAAPGKPG
jgi:hypothetical protein